MPKPLEWKISPEDLALVEKVCARFEQIVASHGHAPATDRKTLVMDLTACHANGCPMDFQRLLDAPNFDFLHDVCGIQKHIDRKTGELGDCFVPRTASRE